MIFSQINSIVIILLLTIISGIADSQGFLHASNIWKNNQFILSELFKSALGFTLGIGSYWVSIKYLQGIGILSPEIQTIGWLIVTTISVAALSGKFIHWHIIDQILALSIVFGLGILLFRTNT